MKSLLPRPRRLNPVYLRHQQADYDPGDGVDGKEQADPERPHLHLARQKQAFYAVFFPVFFLKGISA
jgi:hypothetical protein